MRDVRGEIDKRAFKNLLAPIVNLRLQLEEDLELLNRQMALTEGFDDLQAQVEALCRQYSDRLDELGREDRLRLFRLLNVRLTGSPGRVSVTGILDPSFFTTVRILASSSTSTYSFVIVELKEVISWKGRQKVVEFVPC